MRLAPALLAGLLFAAAAARADGGGAESEVRFTTLPSLATWSEISRRLLSPIDAMRAARQAHGEMDLTPERFVLYVPATAPADGYALMVFVSPSSEARVPFRWTPTLDRHAMIFVSAANSGNDADTLGRRVPLALSAAANVEARYRVDRSRVFVAGFSGGSRVALRLALGYPDIFRGAILDAGSDGIGRELPAPPAAQLREFQEASRLVYLTGGRDDFHMATDRQSRTTMQDWCVFDVATVDMPWTAHELADPASLDQAIRSLEQLQPSDPARLAACRAALQDRMDQQVQQIMASASAGRTAEAWQGVTEPDRKFGGLAAAAVQELAAKLPPGR